MPISYKYQFKFLLVLTWLGLSGSSFALINPPSPIRLKHFNIENGLPGETARTIYQDHSGLIWIGIESVGLCRFDGKNFEIFRNSSKVPSSLSSDFVTCIVEDDEQNLWVGTNHGLNRLPNSNLSGGEHSFERYFYQDGSENTIPGDIIYELIIDHRSALWIATNTGICYYDKDHNTFQRLKLPHIESTWVLSMLEDQNRCLWIGTDRGLFKISSDRKTIVRIPIPHATPESERIMTMSLDPEGNIWFGTDGGLFKVDPSKDAIAPIRNVGLPKPDFGVESIACDGRGNMWLGSTSHGIVIYNTHSGHHKYIAPETGNPSGLQSGQVREIYEDQQGMVWIATKNAGIYLFDEKVETFGLMAKATENVPGLSDKSILSIMEDSNQRMWIGTKYGGLNIYDPATGRIDYITHDPNDKNSPDENRIESLHEDFDGSVWMSTAIGLNHYYPWNGRFERYPFKTIKTIFIDSDHNIWLGTNKGVYQFDRKHRSLKPFDRLRDYTRSIACFLEDNSGNIWIGTDHHGLIEYNPDEDKVIHHESSHGSRNALSDDMVRALHLDRQGGIWIGTKLKGLNYFDPENRTFTYYPFENQTANSVFAILEANDGVLWLGTNDGITAFDPSTGKTINYGMEYGLQGDIFTRLAHCKSSSGMLFFGGDKGLNYFQPSEVRKRHNNSPLIIKSVKIYDKEVQQDIMHDGNRIFKHNDYISIEFVLLDYSSPQKSVYAYKLEGFDDEWIYSDKRNYVSYANLPAGDYTLFVRGANADSDWNSIPATFQFTVLPPWWATWKAYLFFFVITILLVYGLIRLLSYRSRKQNELNLLKLEKDQAEKLNQFKLNFFTNISHELRTPLTLMLPRLDQLKNNETVQKSAGTELSYIRKNTERLAFLVDELLEFRTIEQGNVKLKVKYADIIHFLKEITRNFENLATTKNISYSFRSSVEAIECLFDPNAIEKIISNLLSNAFKYTPQDGEVQVHISTFQKESSQLLSNGNLFSKSSRHFLALKVIDNGIGIPQESIHQIFNRFFTTANEIDQSSGLGIGLNMVKGLVDLHHGEITVNSIPGAGSEFKVILPLDRVAYKKDIILDDVLDLENHIIHFRDHSYTSQSAKDTNEVITQNRILLIEDNPEVREMVAWAMRKRFQFFTAENGQAGLEIAEKELPDLIISDIMMAGMSGLEVVERLKNNFKTSHIPIILLTARSGTENKIKGLSSGADAYVTKPFHLDHLKAEIDSLLENRKKLKDYFSTNFHLQPHQLNIPSLDEAFLLKCIEIIEENMDDTEFSVVELGREVGLSRTHLFRKLKSLTGQTPMELIYSTRLKRAAHLLSEKHLGVAKVAYMTGFSNPSSFSTAFRKHFGQSPKTYTIESSPQQMN